MGGGLNWNHIIHGLNDDGEVDPKQGGGVEIISICVVFVKSAPSADEKPADRGATPAWASSLSNSTTAEGSLIRNAYWIKRKNCVHFFLAFTFTGDNRTKLPRSLILIIKRILMLYDFKRINEKALWNFA